MSLLVSDADFPRDGTVQKIARVELNSRLIRKDLEQAAAVWFMHSGRKRQTTGRFVQNKIVIISKRQPDLGMIGA